MTRFAARGAGVCRAQRYSHDGAVFFTEGGGRGNGRAEDSDSSAGQAVGDAQTCTRLVIPIKARVAGDSVTNSNTRIRRAAVVSETVLHEEWPNIRMLGPKIDTPILHSICYFNAGYWKLELPNAFVGVRIPSSNVISRV